MDGKMLKEWIIEHDAWNKTIEAFWYCFNNYMADRNDEFTEHFGAFDKSKLTLWRKEARLTVRNWGENDGEYWSRFSDEYNANYEFVDMLIVMEYGEEKTIGEYVLRFDMYGESFDDFFRKEWEKWFINIRDQVREERDIEIVKESLRKGLDIETISNITGVDRSDIIKAKKLL